MAAYGAMKDSDITAIEAAIGYKFQNKSLLVQAFTRRSYTNEAAQNGIAATGCNEVLEFCGDSVLGTVIVTLLMNKYGKCDENDGYVSRFDEGALHTLKSRLSDKSMLSERMTTLGLHRHLLLSNGDRALGIAEEASVKEDLFESIIGAVYLDSGHDFGRVAAVVESMLDPDLYLEKSKPQKSEKNLLQEYCQEKRLPFSYETLGVSGPEHDPVFRVACIVEGHPPFIGEGRNVKKAEKAAAKKAYETLSSEDPVCVRTGVPSQDADARSRLKILCDRTKKQAVFTVTEVERIGGIRFFHAVCAYDGNIVGEGDGNTKKSAEQAAAAAAMNVLSAKIPFADKKMQKRSR